MSHAKPNSGTRRGKVKTEARSLHNALDEWLIWAFEEGMEAEKANRRAAKSPDMHMGRVRKGKK